MSEQNNIDLTPAIDALKQGGVVAYPTESCFGLGCDPTNVDALQKILDLKQRDIAKGVILIAASLEQAQQYVNIDDSPLQQEILASWPGPNTWLLPPKTNLDKTLKQYLCGDFSLLAMRVTAHPIASLLCQQFGGAIVSTSANIATEPSAISTAQVIAAFGDKLDYIVDAPIGADTKPSTIRDGLSGKVLRG